MTTDSNNDIKVTSLAPVRRNLETKINFLDENKFIKLNAEIEKGIKDVQNKYDELKHVASPVVENEYLCGLIKSTDVRKSINRLLSIIQGLAECTLGAFQANGDNLKAILELMKISVSIENDLYKQLENCECSKETIAYLLHDFCAQYNIDSNVIEGLFEQSFNRTFILRERIKDLRKEVFERISKYEEKFEHLDETIQKEEEKFTYDFNAKTEEYKKQLEARINEYLGIINSYKKELDMVQSSYKREIESTKKLLIDSIKQYNVEISKQHNTKFEQYERVYKKLGTQVEFQNRLVLKLQNRLLWNLFVSTIATIIAIISFIV